ncbi:hypothetical protein ASE66_24820 [Bosea sp. Root483D1]|uniref:hypothetical protein n=1 Tax=Bosea sp. Root483D1 TaxID=1736544 RepID=UPI00070BC5C3|nr:hypothetical protein [Bosea sp. Root483D1]KRE11732.1 hypothetical protein ASE66_24820 [Bosea sp. Root483D1]
MTVNMEIRTPEERNTVQRLIDRLNGAEDGTLEKARLDMLVAAAKAWDEKQVGASGVGSMKLQGKR